MSSTNKTANFSLNQWIGSDNPKRDDFNQDNSKIDSALKQNADALNMHLADYVRQPAYAITSGAANTYAVTLTPAPTSYVDGMALAMKINTSSTGASTINVNGLGAKTIKDTNGNDITANGLKANMIYSIRYEGTSGNFILQGKGGGGGNAGAGDILLGKTATVDSGQITGTLSLSGTATAAQILTGKTAYTVDPKVPITGTMTNNGGAIITPSYSNQAIVSGYHDGTGYVKGDTNLVSSNIKSGISIFGVPGTLSSLMYDKSQSIVIDSTWNSTVKYITFTNVPSQPSYLLLTLNFQVASGSMAGSTFFTWGSSSSSGLTSSCSSGTIGNIVITGATYSAGNLTLNIFTNTFSTISPQTQYFELRCFA